LSEPQVYVPYRQVADGAFMWYAPKDLVVRTAGEPGAVLPALRSIVAAADPDVPISDAQTLAEVVDGETASRVTPLRVLGAFAGRPGGVGIQGLLAFAVSARTAETGVRMALGASRSDIVLMIGRRALFLAAAGSAIGASLGYVAGEAMRSLLAGATPLDGLT